MLTSSLFFRVYGWIDMILNPWGTLTANRTPIHKSNSDAAYGTDPYIVIGYTPTTITSEGEFSLTPEVKDTPGYYESADMYGKDDAFYALTDGSLTIEIDGDAPILLENLDFTTFTCFTEVAMELQARINLVSTSKVVVEYVIDFEPKFFIVSATKGSTSSIALSPSAVGTDLLDEAYFDTGVVTAGTDDSDADQALMTNLTGVIEIRQCYGNGELLEKVINTLHSDRVSRYFGKQSFSTSSNGPLQSIPFREGNRTIFESLVDFTLKFWGVSRQDVDTIETIGISGELANEDGSGSQEIDI